ncbi:hypothetical protein [Xanthomonas oryzae]|uniref:hypothetical protein n=1 Tax=Xanthomonas oryzae TaxID=347 RepID=UPI001F5F514B|nr:hypothetical protein [Xanthomonas oryzae]
MNYDNLLYQPMIKEKVLHGYNGALVDGFWKNGFAEDNLERKYRRDFGYYMHLHGSPLFVDRDDGDRDKKVMKLPQAELGTDQDITGSHIVLTHVKHKETVIAASRLLTCYWEHFAKALEESESAVLVGYSGCDRHLNSEVSPHFLLRDQALVASRRGRRCAHGARFKVTKPEKSANHARQRSIAEVPV